MGGVGKSSDRPDDALEFDGLALSSEVEDWGIERATATPAPSDRSSSWMEPTPEEQVESINDVGAVPRRHVVESVTDNSIALSSNSSSGHDDGWLLVTCPQCHGELEIHVDQLGVAGSCLWCETPIQAIRSEDGEVAVSAVVINKEVEVSEETPTATPDAFFRPDAILPCPTEEPVDSPNPWESGFSTWATAAESNPLPETSDAPAVAETFPMEAASSKLEASIDTGSIWGAPLEELSTPVSTSLSPIPDEDFGNIFSPVPHERLTAIEDSSPDTGFGGFLQLAAEPATKPNEEPVLPLIQPVSSMIQSEPLFIQPESSLFQPEASVAQPVLQSIQPMPSVSQPGAALDFGQSSAAMSTEQRIFGRFAESATLAPASPPAVPHPQANQIDGLPSLPAGFAATAPEHSPAPAPFSTGEVRPAISVTPKPKKSTHSLRTAFLVIVFGFVCGIALASFVLPTEEYADRARIFLDQFMAPQLRTSAADDLSQSGEAAPANPVAPASLPASAPAGPADETLANPPQVTEPGLPVATP